MSVPVAGSEQVTPDDKTVVAYTAPPRDFVTDLDRMQYTCIFAFTQKITEKTDQTEHLTLYKRNGELIKNGNLGNHLSDGGEAFLVQGTQTYGNLQIQQGKQIPPGGPDLNAEEQETWLEQNTDIQQVNTGEANQLWTMYPKGDEQRAEFSGERQGIRHPGYQFDTSPGTCDNPHADALGRECQTQ